MAQRGKSTAADFTVHTYGGVVIDSSVTLVPWWEELRARAEAVLPLVMKQAGGEASLRWPAMAEAVATATASRKAEHAEFTESQSLNEAANALVEKAKQRLYKFYSPW